MMMIVRFVIYKKQILSKWMFFIFKCFKQVTVLMLTVIDAMMTMNDESYLKCCL